MLYNIGFKPFLVPIVKIFWSLGVRCRARVQDLDKVVSAHFTWGTSNQYCDACFRIHSDAVNKGLNDTPKALSSSKTAVSYSCFC